MRRSWKGLGSGWALASAVNYTMSPKSTDATSNENPALTCAQLLDSMHSLQLSTVGEAGVANCGYTPYIHVSPNIFYIFVSELAVHTRDIFFSGRATLMVIQDEAHTKQMFARTRVSYQCDAQTVSKDDADYAAQINAYEARHGKMVGLLKQLPDFHLIKLVPRSGQFVMGFGKAYHLKGKNLQEFIHARTG